MERRRTDRSTFWRDGAERFHGALGPDMPAIEASLCDMPQDRAGVRLFGVAALRPYLADCGAIGAIAVHLLGPGCRPVRAILFDKTSETNWALGWHQDRTVCVRRRLDVPGFGPWTIKQGLAHVAPPFDLLGRMVTLRAHLDDVPLDNGPLLIAPGSHRAGRVPEHAVMDVVHRCGIRACLADAGDVRAYATPILHASESVAGGRRRRVLQVDYAAEALPGGLEWLGV